MHKINRRTALSLSLAAVAPFAPFAQAQAQADWPSRPITLVLGFAPGGPNDLVARAMALRLSEQLKQQVIVDNKPGASSNIAASIVARAAPDGHTFLYNSSALALNTALMAKMPIDTLRDLAPVNGTATLPLVCIVEPSFPANNFREWAAQLRANPGKFNYGTAGVGNLTHLVGTMILKANGLSAVMMPYKGSSEALQGLLNGSTHFQFDSVNSPLQLIKGGKVKPLFVLSNQRSPVLPDVPTLAESGSNNIDSSAWQGVMAPAKTPQAIIERFAAEIFKAMNSPEMKATLAAQGAYPISSTPRQYAAFFAEEVATYKRIGDEIGIKLE